MPHLLLGAAQEEDVAGEIGRQQAAAHKQQQIQGAGGIAVGPQHVAQHDQLVAALPAPQQLMGQGLERPVVAHLRAEGPDEAAVVEAGDRGGGGSHGTMKKGGATFLSAALQLFPCQARL